MLRVSGRFRVQITKNLKARVVFGFSSFRSVWPCTADYSRVTRIRFGGLFNRWGGVGSRRRNLIINDGNTGNDRTRLRAAEVDEQIEFPGQCLVVPEPGGEERERQERNHALSRPLPQGPDEQRRHHEQLRVYADVVSVRQTLETQKKKKPLIFLPS